MKEFRADDNDSLLVTLAPKGGAVTIDGIKIESSPFNAPVEVENLILIPKMVVAQPLHIDPKVTSRLWSSTIFVESCADGVLAILSLYRSLKPNFYCFDEIIITVVYLSFQILY